MKRIELVVAVLLAGAAARVSAAELGECVGIKDDAVRLFCYDRVAGRAADGGTPGATVPGAIVAPSPTPPAATAPTALPKRVESRIVGSFDGWRQGTRIRLDNGQTWEVIGTGTFNTRAMDAPSVVLERDFIGQMKLAVDGVQPRAAVRLLDSE